MKEDITLSALLCSRLCHDLVGPVGAIGNGIEVMEDESDAEMQKRALELLNMSAEQATRRLKFYRLAFGASGGEGIAISLGDARAVFQEFLAGGRVDLNWPLEQLDSPPDKARVKIILNLALMAAEALAKGGTLSVSVRPQNQAFELGVRAEGAIAGNADKIVKALDPHMDVQTVEPKIAPAYLARVMAGEIGAEISIDQQDNLLEIRCTA